MKKSEAVSERLRMEIVELSDKFVKLSDFMKRDDFETIVDSELERQLMAVQVSAMGSYLGILKIREDL